MGRGRAKAKQAKVARQLKYSGAGTDLEALRKELLNGTPSSGAPSSGAATDEFDDELDDYSGEDDDDLGTSYGTTGRR